MTEQIMMQWKVTQVIGSKSAKTYAYIFINFKIESYIFKIKIQILRELNACYSHVAC